MPRQFTVRLADREYRVELNAHTVIVDGQVIELDEVKLDRNGGMVWHRHGQVMRAILDLGPRDSWVTCDGRELPLVVETERDRLLKEVSAAGSAVHHHSEIRASMPGMVLRVAAQPGNAVVRGEALLILEAMKMENEIRSPVDGVVREVHVEQGRPVEKGDLLLVLE